MRINATRAEKFIDLLRILLKTAIYYLFVLVAFWVLEYVFKFKFDDVYYATFTFCFCAFAIYHFAEITSVIPYIFLNMSKATLNKAVRVDEAFAMLGKSLDNDKIHTVEMYNISFYKSKHQSNDKVIENLSCTVVKLSPYLYFYRNELKRIFGRSDYWCDFEQIKSIVQKEEVFWAKKKNDELLALKEEFSIQINMMQEEIENLKNENKALLKIEKAFEKMKNDEDCYEKLIPLATKTTVELVVNRKDKQKYTKEQIDKIIAKKAEEISMPIPPEKFRNTLRSNLPDGYCNLSGAPTQG